MAIHRADLVRTAEGVETRLSLAEGAILLFHAERIRWERTGIHASVGIGLNQMFLAQSTFNIERDAERVRLANSAWDQLQPHAPGGYERTQLKRDLDLFCAHLWPAWSEGMEPQEIAGDLDSQIGWLLRPYLLEGAGTILFAPPGQGKSYLALLLAVSVDAGVSTLWPATRSRVVYLNLERSLQSLSRRLARVNSVLGLDPRRPLLISDGRGARLSDLERTIRALVHREGCGLVVLDSISRAGFGSPLDPAAMNEVMDLLNRLGCAWLAIGHTPRQDSSHVYGPVMQDAAADLMLQLASERRGDQIGLVIRGTKANDMKLPPPEYLEFTFDESGLIAVERARESNWPELAAGEKKSHRQQAIDFLLTVGEATVEEIAEALGMRHHHASRLLADPTTFVRTRSEGRRRYYAVRSRHE